MNTPSKNILVVSPHPDDEIIGAGASLIRLKEAGFDIINYAASLGQSDQHSCRRGELLAAAAVVGFQTVIPEKPALVSASDDLVAAQEEIRVITSKLIEQLRPAAIVIPSKDDRHHAHETVARAVSQAAASVDGLRLWMYNIWGELPYPDLYSPIDDATMEISLSALKQYTGENNRNDFTRLVRGRGVAATVLGTEKVFGFGAETASEAPYAELMTEVVRDNGKWMRGAPRILDPYSDSLFPKPTQTSLDFWMDAPSPRDLLAINQSST